MENAVKEQQLDLCSDRTSASRFAGNQLRLLFSAFASIPVAALRRAFRSTRLARATAGTLRLTLSRSCNAFSATWPLNCVAKRSLFLANLVPSVR